MRLFRDLPKIVFKTSKLRTSPPLTGVSRALRAKNAEKVSKISGGAFGRGSRKSLQKSRGLSGKSPESLRRVSGECLLTFCPDFLETFSGSQARGLGDTSVFRARRARKRPLQGAGSFPTRSSEGDPILRRLFVTCDVFARYFFVAFSVAPAAQHSRSIPLVPTAPALPGY